MADHYKAHTLRKAAEGTGLYIGTAMKYPNPKKYSDDIDYM